MNFADSICNPRMAHDFVQADSPCTCVTVLFAVHLQVCSGRSSGAPFSCFLCFFWWDGVYQTNILASQHASSLDIGRVCVLQTTRMLPCLFCWLWLSAELTERISVVSCPTCLVNWSSLSMCENNWCTSCVVSESWAAVRVGVACEFDKQELIAHTPDMLQIMLPAMACHQTRNVHYSNWCHHDNCKSTLEALRV